MFYFIGSPSLPSLSFLYVAFPFLIYFILFDSVVFALVFPFQYTFYLSLAVYPPLSLCYSFAFDSLSLSLSRSLPIFHLRSRFLCLTLILVRPVDPSTDDTAVTSKCLFLFRFYFFIPIFAATSHPHRALSYVLVVMLFDAFFLYLMICSKSAYYPDPLSGEEQRKTKLYARTKWNFM